MRLKKRECVDEKKGERVCGWVEKKERECVDEKKGERVCG